MKNRIKYGNIYNLQVLNQALMPKQEPKVNVGQKMVINISSLNWTQFLGTNGNRTDSRQRKGKNKYYNRVKKWHQSEMKCFQLLISFL